MKPEDKKLKSLLKKALAGLSSVAEIREGVRKSKGGFTVFWRRKDGTYTRDLRNSDSLTEAEMHQAAGDETPFIIEVHEREDA